MTTETLRSGTTPPRPQRGRRRAGPGGLRRAGRLRELLVSGVVDSFGMALGWTILVLLAVSRGGLAEAALYNAAMLAGVVLSAPVTGWLSRRLSGRRLLRGSASIEIVLRVAVLGGLIAGWPSWLVATGVVGMHVAAWAGFAGMRAEVTAVAPGVTAMTRYALCIAAVEAVGTGLAALLPVGADGHPTGWTLIAIFVVYAGSLIPTMVSARRARVTPYFRRSAVAPSPSPSAGNRPIPFAASRLAAFPGGRLVITPGRRLAARVARRLPRRRLTTRSVDSLPTTPIPGSLPGHRSTTRIAEGLPSRRLITRAVDGRPGRRATTRALDSQGGDVNDRVDRLLRGRRLITRAVDSRPGRRAVTRALDSLRGRRLITRAGPGQHAGRRRLAVSPRLLVGGGAIMLLASGPTLLAIPLTTELHGRAWVAGAAAAFSVGCLLSTLAVGSIGRLKLPAVLRWSLWGLGMLAGWIFASSHAYTVLLAQFLAGVSQTAFEGDMDARVAEEAPPELVTTALAYSASTRALGGSIAVKLLPILVTAQAIGMAVSAAVTILGVAALLIWAATSLPRLTPHSPAPEPT